MKTSSSLLVVLALAMGCDDRRPRGPSRPDAGHAPARAHADAARAFGAPDGGATAAVSDGGARDGGAAVASGGADGGAVTAASDGGGASASDGGALANGLTFETACRPTSGVPSWPSLAWVGAAPALAYYDGEHTIVARVPEGDILELPRKPMNAAGAVPLAPPGFAASRAGVLLATVEGPGPSPRLLVRRVDASLARADDPREIATAVDVRYGPALLAFAGGWLVGWIDGSGETGRAVVRRLAADGSPRADAQTLSETPAGAGGLALDAWGDRAIAAWIDPHLGFSPISIAWSDASGVFSPPRIVTTTGSVNRAAFVAVAAGPDEGALVVWGHVGPLGQDWLSRTLVPAAGTPAHAEAVSRADAYVTMRAAALHTPDGWAVAWDAPTATGRAPPTTVRLQPLDDDGAARGAPADVAQGFGVTAARNAVAFVRGLTICISTRPGTRTR